ncbi:MAG: HAMP domain-containing protein [Alphaproteobacteria bacterium]|nr:HAMP domain-containing protein [Alphaproteobacteria bacterium]MDE2113081.1 HAMP domain-containing protein [Alphaproteobacteria bacterium]MDE2492870.1 HAMP domain-containing protein [Alphaproteobacteria bacterium]
MRVWPRTLGMQLIVVTAVAVFLSNVAVAFWFELGSEKLNENALTERLLDRAGSIATLMGSIPPKARDTAARALTSNIWHFELRSGKDLPQPMNANEEKLAVRLKAMLSPKVAKLPVTVRFRDETPDDRLEHKHHHPRHGMAIEMTIPVVRNTQLIATFFRPPLPPWPAEISLAAIVAIVVASAAAAYIARRVARPLSKLADAASVAAGGGSAPRVPEVGPDDVRNAAIAFNAMTDQVTRTLESQRQLLSAVGHDLRTPITAMRINIEFVDEPELRERLQKNLDELQDLTEAVLSAARGTGGEARRQIDLAALVESVCADLDDLGEPVEWNGHAPAPICCRANEIRRAVRNLVENAVAYGKKADVAIEETAKAYEIVVDDDGPGIAEADRARVFEPFVRLEGSRNLDTGGSGLGLTLVKAIAEGHGGQVIMENRSQGGLRVRMRLPRDAATA